MWIFKSSKGVTIYLVPGECVVGRKNCELVLGDDQSISRRHAVITITHPQNNWNDPSKIPQVEVSDAGSKYGSTLYSGEKTMKMEKDVKHTLKSGDEIQFGAQWNKWTLSFEPLVVLVSALPKADKRRVKTLVGGLGGHIVSEWVAQTSHLTMASVTMTVKAICALAYAKPIVSPGYWVACKDAVESKSNLPNYEDYVPPLGETVLNRHQVSFLVNPQRRTLFKGKIFYFFSEPQFKDHGCLVQAAGGVPKLVSGPVRSNKQFIQPNSVAMQLLLTNSQSMPLSQAPEVFAEVSTFMKSEGKRLIPASEIGLAVLHCSLEKYCNPNFNFSLMFTNRTSDNSQPVDHGKLLATETQTQDSVDPFEEHAGDRRVIPESGTEAKLGDTTSLVGNAASISTSETQDFVPESLPDTEPMMLRFTESQVESQRDTLLQKDSQSQEPIKNLRSKSGGKRSRVIESDDEIEIIPPQKQRNKDTSNPPVVDLDDSNDVVTQSTSSALNICFSSSRLFNISDVPDRKESNDVDDLFTGFKDYQPKLTTAKPNIRMVSEEINADDLFSDFKDDVNPLKISESESKQKKVQSLLQFSKVVPPTSSVNKRSIARDEDTGPPKKRVAILQTSKSINDNDILLHDDEDNEDDVPFISVDVKKEDESFASKLCNATVSFKSLLVSRNNSTVASSNASVDSGAVNYKKFRKSCPSNTVLIPCIIGGSDLVPYKSSVDTVHEVWDESENEEEDWTTNFWGSKATKSKNRSRKL